MNALTPVETIERALNDVLPPVDARPAVLAQAMRWAVEGGGKRVRPQICLAAAEAVGGRASDAIYPACAIELLHSYTLVHDDLPAMDNDATRRGKPSVWAKFGVATAVLAGDALQALAFQTVARAPRNVPQIVAELGSRGVGVVRGQVEDVVGTTETAEARLDFVFAHKTADLFVAAAAMGAWAGGGTEADVARLREYATHLGFAFQYEDDLLDGDDGAFSSLSIFPRDVVAARVRTETAAAVAALQGLPGSTDVLVGLANGLVGRKA